MPLLRTLLPITISSPSSPLPCVNSPSQSPPSPHVNSSSAPSPIPPLPPVNSSSSPSASSACSAGNSLPVLDFISSDATLDRYSEIISPAGWHLDTYRRNPVFQNAHQYGDIIFTLGKALVTEVRQVNGRQALFQQIQFATDVNPIARIAHGLYAGGFLNAVSVGMVPLRWEEGTKESGFRRRYLEQELLEVSAVALPANPNALALAYKSGAVEKSDLQDTLDLLRSLCPTATQCQPGQSGQSGQSRHSSLSPDLLSFARELHRILRS
jgi:hypothetical protein